MIKKLFKSARVSEDVVRDWLQKQALWQIYLPAPKHVPRQKCNIVLPNEVHQADLLFLPHERPGGKIYKCAWTIELLNVQPET